MLPQYDRSAGMPAWERQHLDALAVQYHGLGSTVTVDLNIGVPGFFTPQLAAQLVQQFVACTRSGAVLDPGGVGINVINPILLAHASNEVGREVMLRIMAKLEPRVACVNSIGAMIGAIDPNGGMQSLNICANFLAAISAIRSDTIVNCATDLLEVMQGNIRLAPFFSALQVNPVVFTANHAFACLDGTAFHNGAAQAPFIRAVVNLLRVRGAELRRYVDDLRFELEYDAAGSSRYSLNGKVVTINGQGSLYNLVSGPFLRQYGSVTHIGTQLGTLPPHSVLKHELGHYLRVGLEGIVPDMAFSNVIPLLVAHCGGWLPPFVTGLCRVWSNSDELTEIFGIICVGGMLQRDHLNQSSFSLAEGNMVRCYHVRMFLPAVSLALFQMVFAIGGVVPNQALVGYDPSMLALL